MGLLDQFRQRKDKEKEKTEGHPIPPPAGHTLAEVMQDKTKSDLFLKLLRKNDDALAMRLAQAKLQESDISLLEDKKKISLSWSLPCASLIAKASSFFRSNLRKRSLLVLSCITSATVCPAGGGIGCPSVFSFSLSFLCLNWSSKPIYLLSRLF